MNRKKDLTDIHCRVRPITAEKLKALSDDLGISMGEVIDQVVDGYEHFCNTQDEWLKGADVYDALSKLIEKVDKIGQKVGVE